ncbi:MAG: beta-galactosidase, partial [Bacteroidetes bacterium]|nr:beta-galactosidase [Bacteroidota bacterium]
YDFLDLSLFNLNWAVTADGIEVADGVADIPPVKPGDEYRVAIELPEIQKVSGTEYFLNVWYTIKEGYNLLEKDQEVAWEQFALSGAAVKNRVSTGPLPDIQFSETSESITVNGNDLQVEFSKGSGSMTSLKFKGIETMVKSPEPDFWRNPTDNDFGNNMPRRCEVWKEAGKNRRLKSISAKQVSPKEIKILTVYELTDVHAIYTMDYVFRGSGEVYITNTFTPATDTLSEIPRMGMQLQITEDFDKVTWFGRGPWENYEDRKYAAHVGLYSSTVDGLNYAYIRPQESGYRTDVRWLALQNDKGVGFLVTGNPLFCFNANHFSRDDFENGFEKEQKHSKDIKKHPWTSLNIDYKQMGVGGDNSWGALPHPQYLLPVKRYSYTVGLRLYDSAKEKPEELKNQMMH